MFKKYYESPRVTKFGDLAALTARVGESMEADVFYSAKGLVLDPAGGSIDSCEVDEHGNVVSNPACPYPI